MINWNKGNSLFINKKDEIEFLLRKYKPDIMAIQELNISIQDDLNVLQFPGYKFELDQLLTKNGRARAGTLIKETINYERLQGF